jgi:hypothetical protein
MPKLVTLTVLILFLFCSLASLVASAADDDLVNDEVFLKLFSELNTTNDQVLSTKQIGVLNGKHLIVIPWGVVQHFCLYFKSDDLNI